MGLQARLSVYPHNIMFLKLILLKLNLLKKASEYDQEIPQSQTADQLMAPSGRATKH